MTSASVDRIERVHVLSLDEIITATVRALRSVRGDDVNDLARFIGISRGSFYNRLNGSTQFGAAEIGKLAEWFEVPVTDFYEGVVRIRPTVITEVVTREYPTATRSVTRTLALVPALEPDDQHVDARYGSCPPGAGNSESRTVPAVSRTVNNAHAA